MAFYIKTKFGHRTGSTIVVPESLLPPYSKPEKSFIEWEVTKELVDGEINTHVYNVKVHYTQFKPTFYANPIPYLEFGDTATLAAFKTLLNKKPRPRNGK